MSERDLNLRIEVKAERAKSAGASQKNAPNLDAGRSGLSAVVPKFLFIAFGLQQKVFVQLTSDPMSNLDESQQVSST